MAKAMEPVLAAPEDKAATDEAPPKMPEELIMLVAAIKPSINPV